MLLHADATLTVVDDHGNDRTIPTRYLEAGHVAHGYAITGHKAQGLTVDHTFVLGSGALYREGGYVAMSRGRQTNQLYVHTTDDIQPDAHLHPTPVDPVAATITRLTRSRTEQPVSNETIGIAARWREPARPARRTRRRPPRTAHRPPRPARPRPPGHPRTPRRARRAARRAGRRARKVAAPARSGRPAPRPRPRPGPAGRPRDDAGAGRPGAGRPAVVPAGRAVAAATPPGAQPPVLDRLQAALTVTRHLREIEQTREVEQHLEIDGPDLGLNIGLSR